MVALLQNGLTQDQQLLNTFSRAQNAFDGRNYTEAERLCNEIVNDPNAGEAKNNSVVAAANSLLGRIYELRLRQNDAYRSRVQLYLQRAVDRDPQNPEHHMRLAQFLERAGSNPTDAIMHYEAVVRLGAGTRDVFEKLAAYYEQIRRYDKAKSLYGNLITLAPNDSNIRYRYGLILQNLGDIDGAKQAFIDATRFDDMNWDAYVALGLIYEKTEKNLDKAFESYKKAEDTRKEARDGLKRISDMKKTVDFFQNVIRQANQAIQIKNIDRLTAIHYRLDSLCQKHPETLEIRQELQKVRNQLSELWFKEAQRLADHEQTLNYAPAAYDSSLHYADTDTGRSRASAGKSDALTKLGVVRKAEEEYKKAESEFEKVKDERAEREFKAKMLEELKKGFITAGRISTLWRGAAEKKQIEIDYFMGLSAFQDSLRFEEAKFYFNQVRRYNPKFMRVQEYAYKATERHRIEEEINFLKNQATLAFNASLWEEAKVYLEKLFPRLDDEIEYFSKRKDEAANENLQERQKMFESKIRELENDKKYFSDLRQKVNAELDKIDWGVILVMVLIFGFGVLFCIVGKILYKNFKRDDISKTVHRERSARKPKLA